MLTQAAPSPRIADSRRRRRVKALQRPGVRAKCRRQSRIQAAPRPSGVDSGSAEYTKRRVHAASTQGPAETRQWCRIQAGRVPGRLPAVLTQAAPSPRSTDTRQWRRVKALQRPGVGAESRRCRVQAVLTQVVESTKPQVQAAAPSQDAAETK